MKIFISNTNPRQTESVPNVNLRIKICNRFNYSFDFIFFLYFIQYTTALNMIFMSSANLARTIHKPCQESWSLTVLPVVD